jgi:uncharacterized protein (DUF1330 family)
MTAYGIAHLRQPAAPLHEDVYEYLERIQSTMDPYGGRFLVHGQQVEVLEGVWPGTLVLIEFPGVAQARAWYDSPAYREILHLRADHLVGDLILVDGCGDEHESAEFAAQLRTMARSSS